MKVGVVYCGKSILKPILIRNVNRKGRGGEEMGDRGVVLFFTAIIILNPLFNSNDNFKKSRGGGGNLSRQYYFEPPL